MPQLQETIDAFAREFGLTPVMAAEIECYVMLADMAVPTIEAFWQQVDKALRHEMLPILRIEKERGYGQFEIVTDIMTPPQLVATLQCIRATVEKYARRNNVWASFEAKPFAEQPSSGMHIHLHLADAEGINAYHKPVEWTSEALRFSLGGLLADMQASMPVFFPNHADYARLDDVDHVPKTAGWGVNNRYCALRIPMHPDPYDKRIEHRVPCANADPARVIETILASVLRGLCNRTEPPEQEYGKPTIGLRESLIRPMGV